MNVKKCQRLRVQWAAAHFMGSQIYFDSDPGACAPGFMLPPAAQA